MQSPLAIADPTRRRIVELLAGAPRPPFWSMFVALKADYEKLRLAAQQS